MSADGLAGRAARNIPLIFEAQERAIVRRIERDRADGGPEHRERGRGAPLSVPHGRQNACGSIAVTLPPGCCEQSGVEPLPDDEARELARRFYDLLAPAFEREFRLH